MNPRHKSAGQGHGPYEPTPRDIRRACERIQAGWSEKERDKRAGRLRPVTWMPPSVDWNALTEAVNEDQKTLQSLGGTQIGV
jgi:hypothetical protein